MPPTSAKSRAGARVSRQSYSSSSKPGRPRMPRRFSGPLIEKSSTPMTLQPSSSRRSTRLAPTKPAAPVTPTMAGRFMLHSFAACCPWRAGRGPRRRRVRRPLRWPGRERCSGCTRAEDATASPGAAKTGGMRFATPATWTGSATRARATWLAITSSRRKSGKSVCDVAEVLVGDVLARALELRARRAARSAGRRSGGRRPRSGSTTCVVSTTLVIGTRRSVMLIA